MIEKNERKGSGMTMMFQKVLNYLDRKIKIDTTLKIYRCCINKDLRSEITSRQAKEVKMTHITKKTQGKAKSYFNIYKMRLTPSHIFTRSFRCDQMILLTLRRVFGGQKVNGLRM